MGDAAILQGEISALKQVFGDEVAIEVAEQTPAVANRLYPSIGFHAGFHAQHAHWPRWPQKASQHLRLFATGE